MSGDGLPHGYSLADLARLTRLAVDLHWSRYLPASDAADAASFAIIERLYQPGGPPASLDLVRVARNAISLATQTEQKHRANGKGWDSLPVRGAVAYWHIPSGGEPRWLDDLLDRIAVAQVMRHLAANHAAVIRALAHGDTYPVAAAILGTTTESFTRRLSNARRAARGLWYAPEPPPGTWMRDRRTQGTTTRPVTFAWRAHRKGTTPCTTPSSSPASSSMFSGSPS